MLFHCAVLAIAALSTIDLAVVSEPTSINIANAKTTFNKRSLLHFDSDKTGGPPNRLLRAANTIGNGKENSDVDEKNEARGGLPGLLQIEGLGATVSKAKIPQQFKDWLRYSFTMEETFKLLKLDDELSALLANPKLGVWIQYGRLVGEENKLASSPVITELTKRYGVAQLSESIQAAKQSVWTRKIAQELEDLQLKRWLDAKTDPTIVFVQLGLKVSKPVLEKSPNKLVIARYIKMYNELYPKI
ncbi:secreted RxLR effector peptide protein, putative [Phytophthora infestans T30-4]|uniref:RxLR effector protein n=2 Tax=Phytophthora infestans TaxID=4787 RepID=A0A833SGC5_PHYIN